MAFNGNDLVPSYGGLASRGDSRVWKCISHVDCEFKVKVVSMDDRFDLFCSMDEHAEVRAALPGNFKGISAEFDGAVKELVGRSLPPTGYISSSLCSAALTSTRRSAFRPRPRSRRGATA